MFRKVLVANRGEIAVRIIRTLHRLGIASVAVYSDADRFTRPVREAGEAVRLGPAAAAESYLDVEAVIAACRATGAEAVHPGYGFLSENVGFAERLAQAGIAFIGPRPEHLRVFGLKHTAREVAVASGVPLLPGTGILHDVEVAAAEAARIGFPVMLKSSAGGGGIGMQLCGDEAELRERFAAVQRTAQASFGDARVFLERFVPDARHVEVQIFGDGRGRVVTLGERDCSLQRRNQKVLEETPAPDLPDAVRTRLNAAAVALGQHIRYASAGTVEFIYDPARRDVFFLEVNTRLQVEHPVTEAVLGIDLVAWMIRQAAGEDVIGEVPPRPSGAAIEVRIYAENPAANFRPSAGLLTAVSFPPGVRVDGWVETGTEVTSFYDPMLAKLIVHAPDRAAAIAELRRALAGTVVAGIATNLDYLRAIAASDLLAEARVTTRALAAFAPPAATLDVLAAGPQSSLQELPGRLGLWHVGVPPSGPMDAASFRRANRLVGNAAETAALEMTISGATLRFNRASRVALSGAAMALSLDGEPRPHGVAFPVGAGQTLAIGSIVGAGQRAYLAVRGGFDVPPVFGSRATFALGGFGGHGTGALKVGDVLPLAADAAGAEPSDPGPEVVLTRSWQVGVVYGPHGAPDFFAEADIDDLFAASYEVHFNSARTGIRLIGPTPRWARTDGGEAGLHPSNLHDNAYAVGALDFTGDMPIILGPDGPSLGGFVCPVVLARDEQWKMGQMRPGDTVRFVPVARPADPVAGPAGSRAGTAQGSPVLGRRDDGPVPVVYRRQGDDNLLVEYGPMVLDIVVRLRVHLLAEAVAAVGLDGVIDITPGIRSLQIHYDGRRLTRDRLLGRLAELERDLPDPAGVSVPSRIVHLPLCWNDPDAVLAMRKYQELVRPDAPWCPDNIEFIRRINGLPDRDAVRRIVFDASYLVLGLGDVYLGAPVATPVDPRHRLVTTKYNPARTWTPENAVGIGGAYLCVYGMEGPGGYQLFGRTIQVWNSWRRPPAFAAGTPWLLRCFDQIRFFPVSHAELTEARAAFPHGAYPIRIEETRFDCAAYTAQLAAEATGIAAFKARQQAAFEAERRWWKEAGLDSFQAESHVDALADDLPPGCSAVLTSVPGQVWKFVVAVGDRVGAGDPVAIVESMKMEMAVTAPVAGEVRELRAAPGRGVRAGDTIAVLTTRDA